jgi:hypothetical protein
MSSTHANKDAGISPTVAGFALSYAITSLISVVVVIIKELSEGVHDGMAAITGHHWITHGLLDIILFIVLGYALRGAASRMPAGTLVNYIVGSTIVSGLVLAIFFLVA